MIPPGIPSVTPPGPPMALMARDAWRLGLGAIRAMPNLFGATFVALLVFDLAFRLRHPPSAGWPGAQEILLAYASEIASDVVLAGAAVAVHRMVLLGEAGDRMPWRLPPGYDRYLVAVLVLDLLMVPAIAAFAFSGGGYGGPALLLPVLLVPGIALTVRLGLALPMAAVEVPEAGFGAGFRMAWAASRGRGWRLFGALLLTFLPIGAGALLVAGMLQGVGGLASVLLDALADAAKATLSAALGAALWSRLLQAQGRAPVRPPVAQ